MAFCTGFSDRLYLTFKDLILTPAVRKASREVIRKVVLAHALTLVGVVYLTMFGILAFLSNAYQTALYDFSATILLGANLHYLRRTVRIYHSCLFAVILMALLFLQIFYSGGVLGTGFMWYYSFPLLSTFLLGSRSGLLAATALLLLSLACFLIDAPSFYHYPPAFLSRFVFSYLAVSLFSYMFEKSRARSQEALEKACQNEEQKVEARTRQLLLETGKREALAAKLRQAQKMEAIGMMAGGVAHDLNNLLTGILTYPDLLLHTLEKESPMRRPLLTIKTSGEKAAAVVADLLTVARGVAAPRAVCDVYTLLDDFFAAPEFARIGELYPGVRWDYPTPGPPLTISCSAVHVGKCLLNLALNAAEAIDDQGQVSFAVFKTDSKLPEIATAIEYVVIEVRDNGPGIAPADLENIFEPFFTKKTMGRSGTGLGLAVVWNTMQDHGGFANVESSAGSTRFRLFFPKVDREVESALASFSLAALKGSGRVLIVDDEALQREIVEKSLALLGYQIFSAASGEDALELLARQPVDLVILDMLMAPGINGRETYAEIIKLYPGQKALIVSGYAESDDILATLQMGAGAFLKKPYSLEELGRAVQLAMTKQGRP
ncbi:MAG: response regulator [Deltaproteobacteria bacterium]|nr:response regulator [Deltaproteobacteria bacterium]